MSRSQGKFFIKIGHNFDHDILNELFGRLKIDY